MIVTFSHACIREILTAAMEPSTRRCEKCSIIPKNPLSVQLSIVSVYIKLLTEDVIDKYPVPSLNPYVKTYWIKHLEEIDFGLISEAAGQRLAQAISAIFYYGHDLFKSSQGVERDFVKIWLGTTRYTKLVRRIITERIHDLDPDQRLWASSLLRSAKPLFQPFIAICAQSWLTKTGWDDLAYFRHPAPYVFMMYAFSFMVRLYHVSTTQSC